MIVPWKRQQPLPSLSVKTIPTVLWLAKCVHRDCRVEAWCAVTTRDYATFHQACVNAFSERLVWVPVMCMFTAHAQVGVHGV